MHFPASPMSALVDEVVTHDLGESTCPPVLVGDLLTGDVQAELAAASLGYRTTEGDRRLRSLLAARLGIGADHLIVTTGGATAMHLLAMVTCDPGDEVVLATPCYPPALAVPATLGADVRRVALRFDDGYRLDLAAVESALTTRTRLVSLASPQNPAATVLAEDAVRGVLELVERLAPSATVLIDETYRETALTAPVPASFAGLSPRIATVSSLSKSHGAPGLRVGWVTALDPALREQLRRAKFNTQVSLPTADEILAAALLDRADEILAVRHEKLLRTLGVLTAWAQGHGDLVEFLPPDGGALCVLRLRADRYDDEAIGRFHDALPDESCRVARGSWFGETDRVFRVGFGHLPEADFPDALAALARALERTASRTGPG